MTRFQQVTGPVMAKGVEDTAFYRWVRLTALNEVGGDPDRFSLPVDEFHRRTSSARSASRCTCSRRRRTTRSAPATCAPGIGALAGMADEWAERARAWRILDDGHENYQLLQALVGAWPIERARIEGYMQKAMREAGATRTGWTPNEAHERVVSEAIGRFYERLPEGFEEFAGRVAAEGRRVSLAHTLLKLTVPGLPDIYQGDELESLNLVDPDNRRPVDWDERRRALADPPPKLRVDQGRARSPCTAARGVRRRLRAGRRRAQMSAPSSGGRRGAGRCPAARAGGEAGHYRCPGAGATRWATSARWRCSSAPESADLQQESPRQGILARWTSSNSPSCGHGQSVSAARATPIELKAAGRALELATAEIERLKAELAARRTARTEPIDDWTRPGPDEPVDTGPRPFDAEHDEPDWRGSTRGSNGGSTAVLDRKRFRPARVLPTGEVAPEPLEQASGRPPRRPLIAGLHVRMPDRGVFIAAGVVLALAGIVFAAIRLDAPNLKTTGPAPNAKIGAVAKQGLAFTVSASRRTLDRTDWVLDGQDIRDRVRQVGDTATLSGASIADGEHWLTVRADGRLPGARTQHTWHFTVHTAPPTVLIDAKTKKAPVEQPMTFGGTVPAGSTVEVGGRRAGVSGKHFAVALSGPPEKPVSVSVTDEYGNTTVRAVSVQIVPRAPRAPVRAVHVTFYAWQDPALRRGVMELIHQHKINTVELDLKDESGIVGFNAPIPLGKQIGAVRDIYNLRSAIRTLHKDGRDGRRPHRCLPRPDLRDGRLEARLEVTGHPDPGRAALRRLRRVHELREPGRAEVQRRHRHRGGQARHRRRALRLRPPSRRPISTMKFPGLKETPERSISTFLGQARHALKPYGTFLGASVFGVAATRPTEVAQNIRQIGRNVDYVAPMVYPSHWGNGEYNVSYPNAEPYQIVQRSLVDFQKDTRGTGARVVPWLQDFTLGVTYGPKQVCDQVKARRPTASTSGSSGIRPSRTRRPRASARRPRRRPAQSRPCCRSRWRPPAHSRARRRRSSRTSSARCR